MPDYAFTVPQVQPVRQSSLADMLTMARGAQAYQQEQQMNPLELRAKQMQVEQAAAVNPLELARIGAESRVATGTETPRIAQAASAARGAEAISNSQQLENLQRHQANFSRESLKLLQNKTLTPADVNDFLVKTIKNAGGNDTVIAQAQSAIPTEGTTADMKAWLARHSLNSLTAESQIEKLFPSATAVNTGAGITPMTFGSPFLSVTPPGTSAGPTTPLTLAPGSTNEPTGRADVNGNAIYVQKDANGNVIREFTATGGDAAKTPAAALGAPAAPPAMAAPTRIRPGETPATYEDANKIRLNASIAASTDPVQQNNNNQIIKLASTATTGKFSELIRNLGGGYATVPWTGNKAEDFDKLGDYMARQTAALAASTGLGGTDAGRALQAEYVGHKGWTEGAIQETARLNRALSTGASFFNQALKTELAKPGSDAITARDFRDQWSNMLGSDGVDAIRLMDLIKNKDQEGMKKFITYIGGKDSTKYQSIKEKASQINSLLKGR